MPLRLSSRLAALLTAALLIVVLVVAPAMAVKPGSWVHHTEADFSQGETKDTIITNLGEVQLAHATTKIAELEGEDSVVYDIARLADDTVIAATGPDGKLVRLENKGIQTVATDAACQIFAIASSKQGLWVGCSGAASRLELRTGKELKVERTIALPGVRYIWAIVPVGKLLWLATGTKGKVLLIDTEEKDPKPQVALEIKQDNVLCLGLDAKRNVYAGTDGEGLVYRITRKDDKFTPFIILDAAEPEVGTLLVLPDGTVYAGTSDADQARPGRLEAARTEPKGRPEKSAVPAQEPKLPNVPPAPEPKQPGDDKPAKPAGAAGTPSKPDTAAHKDEPKPAAPGTPAAPAVTDATPTPQQYQQLREAVQLKLAEAQKNGAIALQQQPSHPGSGPSQLGGGSTRSRSRPNTRIGGDTGSRAGNAIYRINPDGFVKEIFRESVMVLRLIRSGDALLVATGNGGQVFRIDPEGEEVSRIADLEPKQIAAMLTLDNGDVLLGTANPGRFFRMSDAYAAQGTITSQTLDAKQISLWGKLQVGASAPEGSALSVQTRSGNVGDPDAGNWSEWSDPQPVKLTAEHSAYLDVTSPTARFLQYRFTLRSTKAKVTPTVSEIALKYLMPNMEPRITAIRAEYPALKQQRTGPGATSPAADAPAASRNLKIDWEASDPNDDRLIYKLEARPVGSDGAWITIADKLETNSYDWNTRTTPDGRYILRVTASDSPDNVPDQALSRTRRSDPIVVDNSPPDFQKVTVKPGAEGTLDVTFSVTDALSPIADVRYSLSGKDEWKLVLPSDLIYDSTDEGFVIKITNLSPGSGVLTLRATDSLGSTRYLAQPFDIRK